MTTTDTTDPTATTGTTATTGPDGADAPSEDAPARRDAGIDIDLDGPVAFRDAGDELDVFDDVVDPRLRARWIEARRAEGRRRLYALCAVVGVLALGAIAYVIANSSLLGASTIEVHGVDASAAATIRAAAHVRDGTPLLFLDEGAVARRVERVPTVARAEVSTELPSTVVIRVTPRVPVAWLSTGIAATPVAILDRDGRVIETAAAPPPGVVEVAGVGVAARPGAHVAEPAALHALAALPDALRIQVARFVLRPTDGPVLELAGPEPVVREIHLGSLARVRAKATAALAVMDAQRARGERVRVLGVQVPDAPYTEGSP